MDEAIKTTIIGGFCDSCHKKILQTEITCVITNPNNLAEYVVQALGSDMLLAIKINHMLEMYPASGESEEIDRQRFAQYYGPHLPITYKIITE